MPPRTVRYYAHVGLVRPSQYSAAGYGLYGPTDEGKLRFVGQAKALGLSLTEIRQLLDAAERGCCGEVNPELDRILTDKLAAVEERITELSAFRDQLRAYRAGRSGGCGCRGHDPFCGCLGDVAEHISSRHEGRHAVPTRIEIEEHPDTGRCTCGCRCCSANSQDEPERGRETCGCGCGA